MKQENLAIYTKHVIVCGLEFFPFRTKVGAQITEKYPIKLFNKHVKRTTKHKNNLM